MLKFHFKRSQERIKNIIDKGRFDRVFQVRYLVYLKLQPYIQRSLRRRGNKKLAHRYFGPYPVVSRKGQVAYTLNLIEGARVHPTFHVSQLKKHIRSLPKSTTLPSTDIDEFITKIPILIVDQRMVKRGNHANTKVFVEW